MTRLFYLLGFAVAGTLWGMPAGAQSLSSGDYEQCSVYSPDGEYVGLSTECLERNRARIRHYQDIGSGNPSYSARPAIPAGQRFRPIPPIQSCPLWANAGQGYPSTVSTGPHGQFFTYFGTFDSMVNGRRCKAEIHFTPRYN
ncbi:hypothetical protein [Kordiimonas lacus]|uniref:Uncharacterized protein n=1 Tax=Kordiimonas lacus TaxID=637679 RepID=A0A1G6ZY54_9PROT|nr:hypothetical protein [Kordiimonas lacus]SDE07450.1 hypothetical protein SAMN04488071_2005 [Kordiimonas lacus]